MKNRNWLCKLLLPALLLIMMLAITSCGSGNFDDFEPPPPPQEPAMPAPDMADAVAEDAPTEWSPWVVDSAPGVAQQYSGYYSFDYDMQHNVLETVSGDNAHTAADEAPIPETGDTPPTEGYQQAAAEPTAQQGPTPLGVELMQRMIIRTANMSLNTLYHDETVAGVEAIIQNRGGFIENSRRWLVPCPYAGMLWRADFVLRVPVGLFDATNNDLMALAQVQYFSTTSRDATHEFNDLGSRLQIREAEEIRVQRMLDEATELEDIISLESRLTNLRLTIDAYRRRREEIDQLASFSTINLSLFEVVVLPEIVEEEEEEDEEEEEYYPIPAEYGFGNRIGGAFRTSASVTARALEMVAIVLAAIILPASLLAALLAVVYFAAKKFGGGNLIKKLKP